MGSHEGLPKGPARQIQRLGTIHGGAGEVRGADGGWLGWSGSGVVPDPPGHAKLDCALGSESPLWGGGRVPGRARWFPLARLHRALALAPSTQAGGPPGGGWGRAHRQRRFLVCRCPLSITSTKTHPRQNFHSRPATGGQTESNGRDKSINWTCCGRIGWPFLLDAAGPFVRSCLGFERNQMG
jgi:hypothetical protein